MSVPSLTYPRPPAYHAPLARPGTSADDLADAGADGSIFEPMTDLDAVGSKFGNTHAIVSSKVDARTLTFGTVQRIKAEVDATLKLALECPGFMFAAGNHVPSNIPVENSRFYIEYLKQNWTRPKEGVRA